MAVPIALAASSPLLAYRGPIYIAAGFAGIAALALLLVQPLLAAGWLPGLATLRGRAWHRWIGSAIVIAVAAHIGGLYVTSPPDTIDALLLVSPTPFSVYGVLGLVGLILTALLAIVRKRLRPAFWRIVHNALAAVVVVSSVVHALMIEGTMGATSKIALCVAVLVVTAVVVIQLRIIKPLQRRRRT